jgi:hypothetical protein
VGPRFRLRLVTWPAGPLFLLMQGKDVTTPKGTYISAFVQGNTTLDEAEFRKKFVISHSSDAPPQRPACAGPIRSLYLAA